MFPIIISLDGNIADQLPDKKKDILRMLSSSSKDLNLYIKENKCKFKEDDEVVDFFVFVNAE